MTQVISDLRIEGFRALREIEIAGLGRVNLITGRNNTGKSSILEALRILAVPSPNVLASIVRFREENLGVPDEQPRLFDDDAQFQLSGLFTGYPQIDKDIQPILLEGTTTSRKLEVRIRIVWQSREDNERGRRFVENQPSLLHGLEDEVFPAMKIESASSHVIIPMDFLYGRRAYGYRPPLYREPILGTRVPCIYANPYSGESTANLGSLWDNVALSDDETCIIDALRIIEPAVTAVSMIGGEGARQNRTAIVRSSKLSRPIPLRSYGDGMNKLFGVILSLVNAKGGLLLVDEIENGMHHTVQYDAWRILFRLAKELDVQVFATSHSWDAIEAFQQAAAESPEDGVLIRLTRHGEEIVPTLFREAELAIATREGIEVR